MYFNIILSHTSRSPKCSFLCMFPVFSCVLRIRPISLVCSILFIWRRRRMFMKHCCSWMTLPEGKPIYSVENLAQWHILHHKLRWNGLGLNSRLRLMGRWLRAWVMAQPHYHYPLLNQPNNSVRPIPVAARSKTVTARPGSNPAGVVDVCLLCMLCVVR
jgi:hypothetical protein